MSVEAVGEVSEGAEYSADEGCQVGFSPSSTHWGRDWAVQSSQVDQEVVSTAFNQLSLSAVRACGAKAQQSPPAPSRPCQPERPPARNEASPPEYRYWLPNVPEGKTLPPWGHPNPNDERYINEQRNKAEANKNGPRR